MLKLSVAQHCRVIEIYHGVAILYYPAIYFPKRKNEYEFCFMQRISCKSLHGARQHLRKLLHREGLKTPPPPKIRTQDTWKKSYENKLKAREHLHKKDLISRYYNSEAAKRSGA